MSCTPAQLANARRARERFAQRRAVMPKIPCGCGCGEQIPPITALGQPARFRVGHVARLRHVGVRFGDRPPWNKGKPYPRMRGNKYGELLRGRPGRKPTEETRRKLSESHRGKPSPLRGRPLSAETRMKLSAAMRGRKLSPEHIAKISGPNNPHWRGGIGLLPYGPGFTRRLRRLIRERDGHRCQRCRRTSADLGYTLPVHHLDHDKANNDPTNLVASCHRCNVWASYHRDETFVLAMEVA